jgi:hypothetical protein
VDLHHLLFAGLYRRTRNKDICNSDFRPKSEGF